MDIERCPLDNLYLNIEWNVQTSLTKCQVTCSAHLEAGGSDVTSIKFNTLVLLMTSYPNTTYFLIKSASKAPFAFCMHMKLQGFERNISDIKLIFNEKHAW
jgi:hypothetical protein